MQISLIKLKEVFENAMELYLETKKVETSKIRNLVNLNYVARVYSTYQIFVEKLLIYPVQASLIGQYATELRDSTQLSNI